MKKAILLICALLIFSGVVSAQKSKFTGEWEQWWNKRESRGIVIELKEKRGRVSGKAFGAIPKMYEAEIKSAKIVGNSFTAKIKDDWGNTGTVRFTVRGNKLSWRVLNSKIKGSMTFPLKADLKKTK